ncbi:MAG: capsular biosynthesis protein [Epsilonproteobacteria bacterium]|nr:capsular biosynthesis protein [Campylobacterota bacterium]
MIFFKKTPNLLVRTDFHSHLIPGIDDGAKDMAHSLELIKELSAIGYSKLITTPHIKSGQYDNTVQSITDGMNMLRDELARNNMNVHIEAAAEYYYDEMFLQAIKDDNLLHINRYVLFEFSYMVPPINLEEVIYELRSRDYIPVLAHPERYLYYHNKLERYEYLKTLGIHFQINLNSLVGYYSKPVEQVAKYLSQKGLVDFIGSDTHHFKHTDTLKKVFNSPAYKSLFENNKILNDMLVSNV